MAAVDQAYRAFLDGWVIRELPPSHSLLRRAANSFTSYVTLKHVGARIYNRYVRGGPPLSRASSTTVIELAARGLIAQAEKMQAKLVFVYLPSRSHMATGKPGEIVGKADILTVIEALELPVIDLEPVFRARGSFKNYYAVRCCDSHYNAEGYALVAQELVKFMQSAQLAGAGQ